MMSFYCPIAISQPPCPGLLHYHHQHHILPNSPTAPTLVPASVLRRRRVVDARRTSKAVCGARRRVRHDDDDEDDEEEYGHNEEIAMLERYSEWAQDEALLVNASVDDDVELVLVFKGFSSSLSGRTASDPARSVLPERAIIQSIDVVKGPFDPNNVEYLEKGLIGEHMDHTAPIQQRINLYSYQCGLGEQISYKWPKGDGQSEVI